MLNSRMVFIDIGKEYRAKVNEFNAGSFYGASQAKIQQDEQDRTETRSAGGLNQTAQEPSYWETDNPHRSVQGDTDFLKSTSLWNTKFKEKEVNQLQYIQAPQYGYNKNRWVEHLEEIERNRVSNVKPSFNGNSSMVLEVDNSV
jgi:hypothetical protein